MPYLFRVVLVLSIVGGWFLLGPAARLSVAQEEDEFQGLPKGPGQEETFYACTACHSIRLVLQQRMTRADWDETLVYMVEEQAMPKLEPGERKVILDYLGKYLGRDVPR